MIFTQTYCHHLLKIMLFLIAENICFFWNQTEQQGLREQMLADMDERKKRLKEEYESFDITNGRI